MSADLSARAYRLLARRALTVREMERRLGAFAPAPEVRRVVAALVRAGYLDDAALARAFIEERRDARAAGPALLAAKLRARGVARSLVEALLAELVLPVEAELAADLAARRAATLAHLPPAVRRRRLFSFLRGRGFSPDVARRCSGVEDGEGA